MKRMMFVALALLFGLTLWIIKVSWAQKNNPNDIAQRQQQNWFEINAWGTLKVVRNKEGREIFGPGRPPNEGYSIAYQRLHPRTRKPIEGPRVFFAVGDHYSEKQLVCKECERLQRDQAVAAVTTTDGVLRINSYFYLLEKGGKLKIVRAIENISKYPVQLISIRAQYDARLGSNEATQFGKVKSGGPRKIIQAQPQFAPSNKFISNFLGAAAPVIFPSCQPCPPSCELSLILSKGERELICVECLEDGSSVLEYMAHNVPAGQDPQDLIDKLGNAGECEHSIIVDVWNGHYTVDGNLSDLGEGESICVNCSKTGGQSLTVQPISSPGAATNPWDPGSCQMVIHVYKRAPSAITPYSSGTTEGKLNPGEHQGVVVYLDTGGIDGK